MGCAADMRINSQYNLELYAETFQARMHDQNSMLKHYRHGMSNLNNLIPKTNAAKCQAPIHDRSSFKQEKIRLSSMTTA